MALVCITDYEDEAKKLISNNAFGYYKSGAGDEFSLRLNKTAYQRLRIRPRVLRDITKCTSKCNIFGTSVDMPIGIAATAMQKMAHPDGECATARAAGNYNTVFTLSSLATSSLDEVANAAPDTIKWFQLYIYKDRELTKGVIRKAEQCGYQAIVLTVDAPIFGNRRADVRNNFKLPSHLQLRVYPGQEGLVSSDNGSGINEYVKKQLDGTLSWDDVKWLINFSKIPVILKGILTKEDAIIAAEIGCEGVIVSNHGSRQLDSLMAPIEALPEIVEAVGNKLVVMMDGGIEQGIDAFKAIALGAKMVFFGRPAIWGLAVNGQKGVEDVLNIYKKEFDLAMALAGTQTVNDISKEYVIHENCIGKL